MVRDIKCAGCGKCVQACPEQAISMTEEQGRVIDWSRCNQCLLCTWACLYESLCQAGRSLTADEAVIEALKDEVFYKNSGGGVTISGGEPMVQTEFLAALLPKLKETGLHVSLDTTGYAPWEKYERILPEIDLVLFDLKHLDPEMHRKWTGVDNHLILENGARIAQKVRTWLRLPLIPGFNDSEPHLQAVAATARKWGVEKISILPYHDGGRSKAEQIGMKYGLEDVEPPDDKRLDGIAALMAAAGVTVSIRH